LRGLWVRP